MPSIHVPDRNADGSLPSVPSYGDFPMQMITMFRDEASDSVADFLSDCWSLHKRGKAGTPMSEMYQLHRHVSAWGIKYACAIGNVRAVKQHVTDIDGAVRACNGYEARDAARTTEAVAKQRGGMRLFLKSVAESGLQLAARGGHDNIVQYLLSPAVRDVLELDPRANANGAFHEACEHGHPTTAKMLLKAGVVPSVEPESYLMTHLMELVGDVAGDPTANAAEAVQSSGGGAST